MGNTMAAATGTEIFQHRLRVRTAVAFITSFDGLVLFRMALGTLEP